MLVDMKNISDKILWTKGYEAGIEAERERSVQMSDYEKGHLDAYRSILQLQKVTKNAYEEELENYTSFYKIKVRKPFALGVIWGLNYSTKFTEEAIDKIEKSK